MKQAQFLTTVVCQGTATAMRRSSPGLPSEANRREILHVCDPGRGNEHNDGTADNQLSDIEFVFESRFGIDHTTDLKEHAILASLCPDPDALSADMPWDEEESVSQLLAVLKDDLARARAVLALACSIKNGASICVAADHLRTEFAELREVEVEENTTAS